MGLRSDSAPKMADTQAPRTIYKNTSRRNKSSSSSSGSDKRIRRSGLAGLTDTALSGVSSTISENLKNAADRENELRVGALERALATPATETSGVKVYRDSISSSGTSKSSEGSSSGGSTTPSTPSTQTIGTPKTDIDVKAGTPSATTTTSTSPEAMSRTSAGFAQYVSPIANVPTSDELYELYKQMTGGQENEAVRQYLNSADFQSVLGGQIPFWMQTDPIWRRYLQRLGLWSPSPRISALQRYLNGGR